MDDAGVELEVRERFERDSGDFEWRTYLPFSTFQKVDPMNLALYVQNQRNTFAAGAGWDLRDTTGVIEEPKTEEQNVPLSPKDVQKAQNTLSQAEFERASKEIDAQLIREYQPGMLTTINFPCDGMDPTVRRRIIDAYGPSGAGWAVTWNTGSRPGDKSFLSFRTNVQRDYNP